MNDWSFEAYPGESEEELAFEIRRPRRRPPARFPRRPVRRPRPPVRLRRPPVRFIFDQPPAEPERQPAGPEPAWNDFTALLVFRRNLSRQELDRVLRVLDARGLNEE